MDSSGSTEEEASTVAASPPTPSTLSIFHDDILLHILSFVADVPFEIDCEFWYCDALFAADGIIYLQKLLYINTHC